MILIMHYYNRYATYLRAGELPPKITDTLAQAIPLLDRRLHGFALPDAVLTAPETRSSSPVRVSGVGQGVYG